MAILGADPDQLESTATRVLARADDYDDACNHIAYWLRRMDWQGPEADRFHAMFESQVRPQLAAAAAFLRQAASELRIQASAQTKISQTSSELQAPTDVSAQLQVTRLLGALGTGGGVFGVGVSAELQVTRLLGALGTGGGLFGVGGLAYLRYARDLVAPTGPIAPLDPDSQRQANSWLGGLETGAGLLTTGAGLFGVGDLAYLRYAKDTVRGFGSRLPDAGVGRFLGSKVATGLGAAGAGMGLLNLFEHLPEADAAWKKMHDSPHLQPEDAADFADAIGDSLLDTSSLLVGPAAPVGLLLMSLGFGVKVGAQLDTPIIWACDNIIYPAWTGLTDIADAAWDGVTDIADAAWDGVTDIAGTAWDSGQKIVNRLWPF